MDSDDLIKLIAFMALWLLPVVFRALRRSDEGPDVPDVPPPGPLALSREVAAQRIDRAHQAVGEASAVCDPWMARLLRPDLQSMARDLEGLGRGLASGTAGPAFLRRLGEIESRCRSITGLAEQRSLPSFRDLHETGDRLAEGLFRPAVDEVSRGELALEMRPPLVVVGASPRAVPVGTVVLPPAVRDRPWEWSLLAEAFGQRIAAGTVGEAFHALELAVGDEPLTAESEALARVLFSSWLHVVITDASALLLLGPAYLEALAARLRRAGGGRVTRIQLDGEGLGPVPPPHARVHLAAEWLGLQGEERASQPILEAWDEEHHHPEALSLFTAGGEMLLPLGPLFGHFRDLLEGLDGLSLSALGGRRLAEFPGLSGWQAEAGTARAARARLAAGASAVAGPRALLAATTEAGLASPVSGSTLR